MFKISQMKDSSPEKMSVPNDCNYGTLVFISLIFFCDVIICLNSTKKLYTFYEKQSTNIITTLIFPRGAADKLLVIKFNIKIISYITTTFQ